MNERQVLDIIARECRRRGVMIPPRGLLSEALRSAALQISREAETDRQSAARTASIAGFAVTRGRTRL